MAIYGMAIFRGETVYQDYSILVLPLVDCESPRGPPSRGPGARDREKKKIASLRPAVS